MPANTNAGEHDTGVLRKMSRCSPVVVRLVALVVLNLHTLKANILSSHQDFPVQYEFSRTRHPLYIILHTNKHPEGPTYQIFFK
jgi:hypothetical protein